jgi:hypothetical protein
MFFFVLVVYGRKNIKEKDGSFSYILENCFTFHLPKVSTKPQGEC